MKRLLIGVGVLSLLVGCSRTVPKASNAGEMGATTAPRFVPASGNNPYIMFDEETAEACWSGPVTEAAVSEAPKTVRKDGIDFRPLPDAKYAPGFHPDDTSGTNQNEQPTGKFADDGKGIPTCRQLIQAQLSKAGGKYPSWFHPIPSAEPKNR